MIGFRRFGLPAGVTPAAAQGREDHNHQTMGATERKRTCHEEGREGPEVGVLCNGTSPCQLEIQPQMKGSKIV